MTPFLRSTLAGNPLALSRQRTGKIAPRITRYLEPALWQAVKDTIALMPQDTPRARAHYHRALWLFTLPGEQPSTAAAWSTLRSDQ